MTGTDLASLIRKTGATIVFDCTVPEAHSSIALTAFENNCHVLSEKPLAATMNEANAMIQTATAMT